MRERIILLFFITILLQANISVFSQENSKIILSTGQSVKFLQERLQSQNWVDSDDPFRRALGRLIYEASNITFDSTEHFLKAYPYDSLSIPWDKFYIWEPLRFKIPVVSSSGFSIPSDSVFKSVTVLKDTTIMEIGRAHV
jgi:hypothetical protein